MLPSGYRNGVIVARMLLEHKALGQNLPFYFYRGFLAQLLVNYVILRLSFQAKIVIFVVYGLLP